MAKAICGGCGYSVTKTNATATEIPPYWAYCSVFSLTKGPEMKLLCPNCIHQLPKDRQGENEMRGWRPDVVSRSQAINAILAAKESLKPLLDSVNVALPQDSIDAIIEANDLLHESHTAALS